jgi:hypothetical protein
MMELSVLQNPLRRRPVKRKKYKNTMTITTPIIPMTVSRWQSKSSGLIIPTLNSTFPLYLYYKQPTGQEPVSGMLPLPALIGLNVSAERRVISEADLVMRDKYL